MWRVAEGRGRLVNLRGCSAQESRHAEEPCAGGRDEDGQGWLALAQELAAGECGVGWLGGVGGGARSPGASAEGAGSAEHIREQELLGLGSLRGFVVPQALSAGLFGEDLSGLARCSSAVCMSVCVQFPTEQSSCKFSLHVRMHVCMHVCMQSTLI